MKIAAKALIAGFILVGGIALAGEATDPQAKARQDLMDSNGGAVKTLTGMAKGEVAFDAAAAASALKALQDNAAAIPAVFQNQGGADPKSTSKPEVWTNWEEFLKDAAALGTAAAAVDASSVDGLKAGLGGIGAACKDCHTAFKAQM